MSSELKKEKRATISEPTHLALHLFWNTNRIGTKVVHVHTLRNPAPVSYRALPESLCKKRLGNGKRWSQGKPSVKFRYHFGTMYPLIRSTKRWGFGSGRGRRRRRDEILVHLFSSWDWRIGWDLTLFFFFFFTLCDIYSIDTALITWHLRGPSVFLHTRSGIPEPLDRGGRIY